MGSLYRGYKTINYQLPKCNIIVITLTHQQIKIIMTNLTSNDPLD